MGVEEAAHLGSVVVFTVQVIVPRVHAELPLAGADGWGARAVTGEGRCHRDGLHPGFSPESSFTYARGMTSSVARQEKCPCLSPPRPACSLPAPRPPGPLQNYSQWKVSGNRRRSLPFSEQGLCVRLAAKHETFCINVVF